MLLPVDRYELQHPVSFQVRSTFLHAVRRSEPRPHEIPRLEPDHFYRVQSLFFAIVDILSPYIAVTGTRVSPTQRLTCRPAIPRHRTFAPLRAEARQAGDLLRQSVGHHWTIDELASEVHLSASHLSRVFAEAFGKAPMAYLTMLRVEKLAYLLRTTERTIAALSSEVGWADPDYAGRQFRRSVGLTPRQYRSMIQSRTRAAAR